jgi:small GTP-binding protein
MRGRRIMTQQAALRNIGIVAHVDAGKTTITENMLYISGRIRTLGSVDRGTTHTDWMDIERERGISVRAASTSFVWRNVGVNLIDTPGHMDFSAEIERSLRVLDGAVMVVSAVEGVQAQTELVWKALRNMNIPTILFINKIDRAGSEVARVLEEIRETLSADIIPVQLVEGEGSGEFSVLHAFKGTGMASLKAKSLHEQTMELLAGFDEEILGEYIQNVSLSPEEIYRHLARITCSGRVFPVLIGAAVKGVGMTELLDAILDLLPPPVGEPDLPVSGIVFKIEHDRTMGRIAHVRLYNGTVRNRDPVYNATQDIHEKVTQIRKTYAQKHEDTGLLQAGDIASVCGMSSARIGDIIGSPGAIPQGYRLAVPLLAVQAFPEKVVDYPQLVAALQELSDEDPLLGLQWLKEERELHVRIMGLIQLEVLTSLLKSRFSLQVTFGKPSVIYKETPARAGDGFVAYTMPKPCWAVLRFRIEPGERGSGLQYASVVRDEAILLRYQNQVEKTLPEALKQGLYGWEVTDLKVTLIEGEHHVMHTHPLDFVVATPMGIMDGLMNTGTTLLEPVLRYRISVPAEVGSKVLGDILHMRGQFDSPVIAKEVFTVEGCVPASTSLEYPIRLGILSGGRGTVTTRFDGYRECPLELGASAPRRGIDPRDHSKYILSVRKALG